jgi:hypothetical protein
MTLDEMKTLYVKTMGPSSFEIEGDGPFTVRVYDGMDHCWCDVLVGVDLAFALQRWCKETKNGTEKTCFDDIDYYRIFPANTRMLNPWARDD